MSSSRVLWSDPSINRSRKINNAKQLNDVSIQSLKCQIVFFLVIVSEICLNIVLSVIGGGNISMYIYKLICKTLLGINIVYIMTYVYQIIQARYEIYLETRKNKSQSILLNLTFELLPQIKCYYERLIKSKWLSQWLQKEAIERQRIQARLDEDRRKTLYKMYLPSMNSQYRSYGDQSMKTDMYMSGINGSYGESMNRHTPDHSLSMMSFRGHIEPIRTSTPYSSRREASPMRSPCPQPMDTYPVSPDMWSHSAHKYQPSSPSPARHLPGSPLARTSLQSRLHSIPAPEIWRSLGIDPHVASTRWPLSLRQWLHGTVVSRIVQEIDKVNDRLRQLGISDVTVGEAPVQTLRQLAAAHPQHLDSLAVLAAFLDCSRDQPYIANRLRELVQGASLAQYRWDAGSTSARHPWREHLPNDCALLLHLLCTYIDSRGHARIHGHTKTFAQQTIVDSLPQTDTKGDDRGDGPCLLVQTAVQPPHLQVAHGRTLYEVAPGRRNLFDCLLIVLLKAHRDEGHLGGLNLGRAGLNLNWIFEEGAATGL